MCNPGSTKLALVRLCASQRSGICGANGLGPVLVDASTTASETTIYFVVLWVLLEDTYG